MAHARALPRPKVRGATRSFLFIYINMFFSRCRAAVAIAIAIAVAVASHIALIGLVALAELVVSRVVCIFPLFFQLHGRRAA